MNYQNKNKMGMLSDLFQFLKELYVKRALIMELIKRDLKNRFVGSYLGVVWAFINPAIMILILWFVFEMGFRLAPVQDFPFILWLCCGIIPWFFFSDGIQNATSSIMESSFLVKRMAFRVGILPLVKILSALVVHSFFILLLFVMFFLYGYCPDIYNLQVIYYLFAMIVLMSGMSWITSSSVLFFRDIGQLVSVVLNLLFWGTPIFWTLNIVPERYHLIFKMNPIFYIVEGYRGSFITKEWFWQHPYLTLYFWGITASILIAGVIFFKRLRPHFADVL